MKSSSSIMPTADALAWIAERYGANHQLTNMCREISVESGQISPSDLIHRARVRLQTPEREQAAATVVHEFTSE